MKTKDLHGARLNYWVARALGTKAEELTICRSVKYPHKWEVVRQWQSDDGVSFQKVIDYYRTWNTTGPLLKIVYGVQMYIVDARIVWRSPHSNGGPYSEGQTPMIAICREVVRLTFGDDVEDM